MPNIKRYVVGPDANGKSATLLTEATNIQEMPGFFWRATLWSTSELPADNSIDSDRSLVGANREPPRGGMLARTLEVPPDSPDRDKHIAALRKANVDVNQPHMPSAEDLARHPSMHRTDTLDVITCVKGEIYLITDIDEFLMTPGDTVIIRGTNHAWSNRSDKPALLSGCMIDTKRD